MNKVGATHLPPQTADADEAGGELFNDSFFDSSALEAMLSLFEESEPAQESYGEAGGASAFSDEQIGRALLEISRPKARKGWGQAIKRTAMINVEDFDTEAERHAFLFIRQYVRQLFVGGHSPKQQIEATRWLLSEDPPANGISFDLCCDVLGARIDVLRLRVTYEMWRKWVVAPAPISELPLPEILAGEINFLAGREGLDIADLLFQHPGTTADVLFDRFIRLSQKKLDRERFNKRLTQLEDHYIASTQGENWYLTGRNPMRFSEDCAAQRNSNAVRGRSVNWSEQF